MIKVFACYSLLIFTSQLGSQTQGCPVDCCETSRLLQLVINAKIDPAALPAALDELSSLQENQEYTHHITAALYFWELKAWANFLTEDDPKLWPDRMEQTTPTMVFIDEEGKYTVFYGAFAYRVGSQFKKSGWYITEITPNDMEIEHQGNSHSEATWVKRVSFRGPYLRPILVGPEGFSRFGDLPLPDWEALGGHLVIEGKNP